MTKQNDIGIIDPKLRHLFDHGRDINTTLNGEPVTLRIYKGENTITVNPVALSIIGKELDLSDLKGNITLTNIPATGVAVNPASKGVLDPNLSLNNYIRHNDGNKANA
jgi:hypothetical protein